MNKIINKKRILVSIILIGALFIAWSLLGNKPIPGTQPPTYVKTTATKQVVVENTAPGITPISKIGDSFGTKLKTEDFNETLQVTTYAYENENRPVEVYHTREGQIIYMVIPLYKVTKGNLYELQTKYELEHQNAELYNLKGMGLKAYVYYKKGVIFELNPYNGTVFDIVLFNPTRQATLLTDMKGRYSETPSEQNLF